MQPVTLDELKTSRLYSEELGIDLAGARDEELFKWFLASILLGARESEVEGLSVYKVFEKYGLLSPRRIIATGLDFLTGTVLAEATNVPDDTKTARDLLSSAEMLVRDYAGSLSILHERARNEEDLESDLLRFYGIGPVTVNIFLRELRPHWPKDDVEILPVISDLARENGIELSQYDRKSVTFTRIEAGLLRLRRYASHRP